MNILLLSSGGGGGNILRSLKGLFRRDVSIAQQTDARYADRLRRSVVTRFLDTNEFSLADIPKDERVLIGAPTRQRLGSRHNPEVARQALEESRGEVEHLLSKYSVVILIGTGGKGTGAGTMFPLAQLARDLKKLVIPIFVRPSFERHEVDKRRYDHACAVVDQFDAAGLRLIEILNDRGYIHRDPQPQSLVWERMNLPIARGLRGFLYVLSDLSQVDPSDLSTLFAGHGRLRMGFAEINPRPSEEPSDTEIETAARECWQNPYYAFDGPVGTSLICIHGQWSNLVDAGIKGRLATLALNGAENPYNPLYARAFQTPKPWGVTAIFSEYTGQHRPVEIDWSAEKRFPLVTLDVERDVADAAPETTASLIASSHPTTAESDEAPVITTAPRMAFAGLWEFAVALNHGDPAALALAENGDEPQFAIEAGELKKLLGTFWFRSAFAHLSENWRNRLLDVLVANVALPNHIVRVGRHTLRISELTYDQLSDMCSKTMIRGQEGADLQLLLTIGKLWGGEVLPRIQFVDSDQPAESKFATLLQGILG